MAPEQVGRCSLWQLAAAVDGWNRAQSGDDPPEDPPTATEFYDIVERLG